MVFFELGINESFDVFFSDDGMGFLVGFHGSNNFFDDEICEAAMDSESASFTREIFF